MAAPFPPEAAPGGDVYSRIAQDVYRAYSNIARLSNDIVNVEPTVDLQKVAQLAFVEALNYINSATDNSSEFKTAVQTVFSANGIEWPADAKTPRQNMVDDLVAILNAITAYRDWVDVNTPGAKTPATVTYTYASTAVTTVSDTVPQTDPVYAQTVTVRALFA